MSKAPSARRMELAWMILFFGMVLWLGDGR